MFGIVEGAAFTVIEPDLLTVQASCWFELRGAARARIREQRDPGPTTSRSGRTSPIPTRLLAAPLEI